MYILRLWFANERLAIARDELEPHRNRALLQARSQRERDLINREFDKAVIEVADKIHPLRILRIRK